MSELCFWFGLWSSFFYFGERSVFLDWRLSARSARAHVWVLGRARGRRNMCWSARSQFSVGAWRRVPPPSTRVSRTPLYLYRASRQFAGHGAGREKTSHMDMHHTRKGFECYRPKRGGTVRECILLTLQGPPHTLIWFTPPPRPRAAPAPPASWPRAQLRAVRRRRRRGCELARAP